MRKKTIITKLGMQKEFDMWIQEKKKSNKFPYGSFVTFIKDYEDRGVKGLSGKVVKRTEEQRRGVVVIDTELTRVPMWKEQMSEYLRRV